MLSGVTKSNIQVCGAKTIYDLVNRQIVFDQSRFSTSSYLLFRRITFGDRLAHLKQQHLAHSSPIYLFSYLLLYLSFCPTLSEIT